MPASRERLSFFHQYTAAILIFLLFVSQTIQVSFFDSVGAKSEDYRDVVSIIVDRETYGSLRNKINRYAEDIQGYLKSTRVTILVAPSDVTPAHIAAQNEKLYYEGDSGDGVSRLVGTILVGNIPIPVVRKEGLSFPSIYPYVDFDNKRFVYDPTSGLYEATQESQESSDVDIWHGVINPAVGRDWAGVLDIRAISDFFDKTHDFYTRSGKFVPLRTPPRVFYYDGYNESLSTDPNTMYKYALYIQNIENIAYNRWSKYLLSDVMRAMRDFQSANAGSTDEYAASLGLPQNFEDDTMDQETIDSLPDIQTKQPILNYVKRFYEVINKKTLSDIQKYVYNAGRYNSGTTVRVDQGAISMTITDEVARDTLKSANDALEQSIDTILSASGYARPLLILDSIYEPSPLISETSPAALPAALKNPLVEYKNYFFGREARTITSPDQCTISRGSSGSGELFRRPVLVEANIMYDINSISSQVATLSGDTSELVTRFRNPDYACFSQSGIPKLQAYYGGNSLMRLAATSQDPSTFFALPPSGTSLTGFSLPITSLAGAKESNRLPAPSLSSCLSRDYQYALLQPHTYNYMDSSVCTESTCDTPCSAAYPDEWNTESFPCTKQKATDTPRFTCITKHISRSGGVPTFESLIGSYQAACTYGSVKIDNRSITPQGNLVNGDSYLGNLCISETPATESTDATTTDTTVYKNASYHTIPSLLKHVSPTQDEIEAAEGNGVTPSLPIDIVRSIEFLTPKGAIARLSYPNFFAAPTESISSVRSWLTAQSEKEWSLIMASEAAITQTDLDKNLSLALGSNPLPSAPIDWNTLISDEMIEKIIQAKRWLNKTPTQKYNDRIKASLSYSQTGAMSSLDDVPLTPRMSEGYEIAYLGLTSFLPKGKESGDDASLQEYQYRLGEIQGLNFAENDPSLSDPDQRASAECGPPEGVDLFRWPQAIVCWMRTLFPIKITAGSCGGNTIGLDTPSYATVGPPASITRDSTALRNYYTDGRLVYSIPRTTLQPYETLDLTYRLDRSGSLVSLPPDARVSLEVVSLVSEGRSIPQSEHDSYLKFSTRESPYTSEGSSFALYAPGPLSTVTIRPLLTIPLPDGSTFTLRAEALTIRVTDEYIDITPMLGTTPTSTIDTTATDPVSLVFTPKKGTTQIAGSALPYTLSVYDDVDGALLEGPISVSSPTWTVPARYRNTIGVYRFTMADSLGRTGESTLAVRSGPLARLEFRSLSSTIASGSDSYGVLRLLDGRDNLVSPTLTHIDASIQGGYFVDSSGNKQSTMSLDTMENEILFPYSATGDGPVVITFRSKDPPLESTTTLRTVTNPRVKLMQAGNLRAGGDPVSFSLQVVSQDGQVLTGFSSLATLDIPDAAGSFSSGTIEITDGKSDPFLFTPGKAAGDHIIRVDIPGVGASDHRITIDPGPTLYIDGTIDDTSLIFTLRDRYGNRTRESIAATVKHDLSELGSVTFVDGQYRRERSPGYWKIVAPAIENNTIIYTDIENIQNPDGSIVSRDIDRVIAGISYYQMYVPDTEKKFSFLPDYNARYTVLAGGSALPEASEILYNIKKGESQSLAVTTLLTSPYERQNLFSVVPGGGISVGSTLDTAIETTLRSYGDTLVLDAYDAAGDLQIARVAYPVRGLPFTSCEAGESSRKSCNIADVKGGVKFVYDPSGDVRVGKATNYMSLLIENTPRITYNQTTGISLAPGVTLKVLTDESVGSLFAEIRDGDDVIGYMIVRTPIASGVTLGDASSSVRDLTLGEDHAYSRNETYHGTMDALGRGYEIVREPSSTQIDNRLIGPSHIDSLGTISDSPGVGWYGSNRSLLSFAAGDIVGEATRWFQSYTSINLGDPVAHVDSDAPGTETEGLDRSIGTQIASGNDRSIQSFLHKDMDADGRDDIIVLYSDGFVELYLNIDGKFRKRGKIAYIPNLTTLGIELGDFTGDKYADIIALDGSGSLVLYDNTDRRIREPQMDANLLPEHVTQFRVYDMDKDDRDDVVYLTDGGELGILYGTQTPGSFQKKVLDSSLGITLSPEAITTGGAIRSSTTPSSLLTSASGASTDPDISILNSEIFTLIPFTSPTSNSEIILTPNSLDTEILPVFDSSITSPSVSEQNTQSGDLYIRSEYAPAYGLSVSRSFVNPTSSMMRGGDQIRATITIRNTTQNTIKDIKYLDTLPKIFTLPPQSAKYRITSGSNSRELPLENAASTEYDLLFRPGDLAAGQTFTITYDLEALRVSYGDMIVGDLESGLVGADPYGDVGFETSNTCGADMLLWASTATRDYQRTTRSFSAPELPASLAPSLIDTDKNGIPDHLENLSLTDRQDIYRDMTTTKGSISGGESLVKATRDGPNGLISIGLSPDTERNIENIMQNLADGLSCGFGGGGCISFPVNWAPLAPGNAISFLGAPISGTPSVRQGIPIFSAMTGIPIYGPWGCFPMPAVWPPSPIGLESACSTNTPNAGGLLGTTSLANNIRIFVTPTLTLGMGTAMCFGGAPAISGLNPLYPLIPKGNCIIITKPMNVCKGDGSAADGDLRGFTGLGTFRESWNSASCMMKADLSSSRSGSGSASSTLTEDILSYLKSPSSSRLGQIYGSISTRGPRRAVDLGGPFIRIGEGSSTDAGFDISLDSTKPLTVDNIIKVRNKRISAFPEFIMDWFTRQTEEAKNKLFTLPNLIIIPPKSFGPNAQFGGDFSDFVSKFSEASIKKGYSEFDQKLGQVGASKAAESFNKQTTGKTWASKGYNEWLDKKISENASTINRIDRGANQMRAAYQFIGKLPFLQLEEVSIPISIPWFLPQDLDRYARTLTQYQNEIQKAKKAWCDGKSAAECADQQTSIGLGGLESGIKDNLRRIEEWRRFPEKIQKYITWKQRYIAQVLCNVDILERTISGWYRDNGIRFKKWAEFWVLMQAVVKSWQPFLDIWTAKDRSCSVCQNQRWDLNTWKFKLLSAVIPQIPILQFPRWPDVVLDLSDVRFAVLIRVPNFRFNINPIRLPDLPALTLPGMPSLTVGLPGLPKIPAPPSLPNLPDLPSLPKINFPNLPPPPKLPKLFGSISVALNIAKLIMKIDCFRNNTFLVPEDYAGATIAQRTDRQGTLPFDFLNIRLPQISIGAWPREIRVSTHVNFQLKSDFIVEFAKSAVKPLEGFNTDFSKGIPRKIGPDINIQGPGNKNITPLGLEGDTQSLKDALEEEKNTLLTVDEFIPHLRREMVLAGLDASVLDRALISARRDADRLTESLLTENAKSFTLMRNYLDTQAAEAQALQDWLRDITHPAPLLSESDLPLAAYVSDPRDLSEGALSRYQSHQSRMLDVDSTPQRNSGLSREIGQLTSRMDRLVAATTTTPSLSVPSGVNLASGYSPNFQGIYVLTPVSRSQIRLFDYTDTLYGSEMVDITDIDSDGDDDYIYMLDGAVYVKYGHNSTPDRPIDTTVYRNEVDTTKLPEAPDFFTESVASPGQIELSFAPAHPLDRQFRLEFYDQYLEWDREAIGASDSLRTIFDLTVRPDEADAIVTSYGMTAQKVDRSLQSVSSTAGFTLEGVSVDTLRQGSEFNLSSGRPIYTGNSAASLSITDRSTGESRTVSLDPFGQYSFVSSLSGVVLSGRIYILTPSGTQRLGYSTDMIGMPLIPGIRIVDTSGKVEVYDPIRQISTRIPQDVEYRHVTLGRQRDIYRLTLPYQNGFYSSRLHSLRTGDAIRAGVTLLAPLAALDRSSPELTLSNLKVPVYQSQEVLFRDVISEMSPFTMRVDPDLTTDTDKDGDFENDYTTAGPEISLSPTGLLFGKYATLGTRMIGVDVIDAYSNRTTQSVDVDVYAPIPRIDEASKERDILGSLDEDISNMPIHIFRVREGAGLTLLRDEPVMTDNDGAYTLSGVYSPIRVTATGGSVANILSPYTLLPTDLGLRATVSPATSSAPVTINLIDDTGVPRYNLAIVPPNTLKLVTSLTDPVGVDQPRLLVESLAGVTALRAKLDDPSIPGGMYLVEGSQALIALDSRGQLYQLDPSLALIPKEVDKHLVIEVSRGGQTIARLSYLFDFFPATK